MLWNRHDQQRIEIDGLRHATRVNGVRVSLDGRRAVSFDASGQVKVWRIDSREPGPVLSHIDYVSDAAFSRDGKRLVTGGHDRTAQVWDVDTGEQLYSVTWFNQLESVSSDRTRFATSDCSRYSGRAECEIVVRNMATGANSF